MKLGPRLPEGLDEQALVEIPMSPDVYDLTTSNPTQVGLKLDAHGPSHLTLAPGYEPSPRGSLQARAAVAAMITGWGRRADADDVVLTAGTSEALSYLFKAFVAPGDSIAVAQPGYPLIAHIAELEGLLTIGCALRLAGDVWQLDMKAIGEAFERGAKMVVLVSPHNPTGARLDAATLAELAAQCRRYSAALVLDEVFACYGAQAPQTQLAPLDAFDLAFSLGGLSKAGLWPQLKLAWIQLTGHASLKSRARAALEWVSDAFLSLSQPVVDALPQLVEALPPRQALLQTRLDHNRAFLRRLAAAQGFRLLPHEAGWYALVDFGVGHPDLLRARRCGVTWARRIEQEARVAVLSPELFDLDSPSWMVTSLIVEPELFALGWQRLARYLAQT